MKRLLLINNIIYNHHSTGHTFPVTPQMETFATLLILSWCGLALIFMGAFIWEVLRNA